jgi:chorismate mutase
MGVETEPERYEELAEAVRQLDDLDEQIHELFAQRRQLAKVIERTKNQLHHQLKETDERLNRPPPTLNEEKATFTFDPDSVTKAEYDENG